MDDRRISIEELLEFPTDFDFKAIGHHTLEYARLTQAAAERALGGERRVMIRKRLSRKGTYLSVTLTARVESAQELRAVYQALRAVEGTLTVL